MNYQSKKTILKFAKLIFGITLFICVFFILKQELQHINISKVLHLFTEIDRFTLIPLILAGCLALLILCLYDVLLTRILSIKIPLQNVMRFSYIINAFNAVLGFGGIIGASVRMMFYKSYVQDRPTLIRFISYILVSMMTGLSFLGLFMIYHFFYNQYLLFDRPWLAGMYIIVILFLPFYLIYTFIKPVIKGRRRVGLYCMLISCIEWLSAFFILYFCFIVLNVHIDLIDLLSLFIIASISGLISFVPGGFGAFDLVMVLGLKSLGIDEELIVLGLLLYRFVYYIAPLCVAVILMTFELGQFAKRLLEASKYYIPAKDTTSFIRSFQKDILRNLPHVAQMVVLSFSTFIYFIYSVSIFIDGIYDNDRQFYLIILSIHISACLLLFLNFYGVFKGSKRAILFSIVSEATILFTTLMTFATSFQIVIIAVNLFILLKLFKKAKVLKRTFRLKRFVIGMTTLLCIIGMIQLSINEALVTIRLQNIEMFTYSVSYSFLTTFVVISFLVMIVVWLFERRYKGQLSKHSIRECEPLLERYGGHHLSHLMFTGNKQIFIYQEAFLIYKMKRNTIVVLGDPIGNVDVFEEMLSSFYAHAEYLGYDIVFYQVSERYLSLYHSFGNQFFKLGEEALINLNDFSISGKKKRGMRATLNKLEALGYQFEYLEPPYTYDDWLALTKVSDRWLEGRKEKYFSIGHFTYMYVSKAAILVLRDKEGVIQAFCTEMPSNNNDAISVDLIRWNPEIKLPFMDTLYIHSMLYYKEKGFQRFNMGMATLSNVGHLKYAYSREKFARRVYDHFNGIYRFKGLRQYKEKFKPSFESRYLIYHAEYTSWQACLKVISAIHRK